MTAPLILCVTLNPVLDASFFVAELQPVYRTEANQTTYVAGGKGNNVARALAALGQRGHSLVALGGLTGHQIAVLMEAEEYESTPAWVQGESRLQATVITAAGEQRAFYAPAAPMSAVDAAACRRHFLQLLPQAWAVCLCGSTPGGYADALFTELLALAHAQGRLTLLDSSGRGLQAGLASRPDIVKVNRAEVAAWLNCALATRSAEIVALEALHQAAGEWTILTLGEEGALLAAERQRWHALPPRVRALNPIASGDAMTAGLLAGRARGLSPVECFRLGMAAAAANTLTWEACRFDATEVARLLDQVVVAAI